MAARRARALSLFALLLVGCSGAGNADLFNGDPGEPASAEQNDTSASDPGPSTNKQQPTVPGQFAAAPPPAADTPPVAPDPMPKCPQEAEPNNDINKATLFTTSLCGQIGTASDVDFVSFVVPAGKTEVAIKHDAKGGKIAYRYYLQGIYLPIGGDGMKVIPGATYSIQMKLSPTSASTDRPSYQVDISFK